MPILIVITLLFSQVSHGKSIDVDECVELCKEGNPKCFSWGPAFKKLFTPIRQLVEITGDPDGSKRVICEGTKIALDGDMIVGDGSSCTQEHEFGLSILVPKDFSGAISKKNSRLLIQFDRGEGLLFDHDHENEGNYGEIDFITPLKGLIVFGYNHDSKKLLPCNSVGKN